MVKTRPFLRCSKMTNPYLSFMQRLGYILLEFIWAIVSYEDLPPSTTPVLRSLLKNHTRIYHPLRIGTPFPVPCG